MTQAAEPALDEAARLIASAGRVAVLSHVNPDADALGSVIGLARGLRALGKEVVAVLSDPVPVYARFLAGSDRVAAQLGPEPFDLFIFADAADIARVGPVYLDDPGRFETAPLINLDHHGTNPGYGTVNYVVAGASSSSELVYRLLRHVDAPVDGDTATALLFGIVGDTGSFRNGATTASSLRVAAELVEAGADNQEVAFQLFEWKTFSAARIWGRILSHIELDRRRHIVFAYLSREVLAEEGANEEETEGVAEYLRGIEEAEVVMLLKEKEDGAIRVSMRSRPSVDVAAIATALGGGGHRQAAGCTIPGSFGHARTTLVAAYDQVVGAPSPNGAAAEAAAPAAHLAAAAPPAGEAEAPPDG